MPFKSKAQQRFMFAAEADGDIPKGTAKRWAKKTDFDKLPEKVKKAVAYKLQGRTEFQGLPISIENRKGSVRKWFDPHGNEKGSTKMHWAYGYIRGTRGTDGDHVDVYIGPNPEASHAFIVDQMKKPEGAIKKDGKPWKDFDEQKCMLGWDSAEEAKAAYMKQYDDPRFFGSIKAIPMEQFKEKVMDRQNHGKKVAELRLRLTKAKSAGLLKQIGRHAQKFHGISPAARKATEAELKSFKAQPLKTFRTHAEQVGAGTKSVATKKTPTTGHRPMDLAKHISKGDTKKEVQLARSHGMPIYGGSKTLDELSRTSFEKLNAEEKFLVELNILGVDTDKVAHDLLLADLADVGIDFTKTAMTPNRMREMIAQGAGKRGYRLSPQEQKDIASKSLKYFKSMKTNGPSHVETKKVRDDLRGMMKRFKSTSQQSRSAGRAQRQRRQHQNRGPQGYERRPSGSDPFAEARRGINSTAVSMAGTGAAFAGDAQRRKTQDAADKERRKARRDYRKHKAEMPKAAAKDVPAERKKTRDHKPAPMDAATALRTGGLGLSWGATGSYIAPMMLGRRRTQANTLGGGAVGAAIGGGLGFLKDRDSRKRLTKTRETTRQLRERMGEKKADLLADPNDPLHTPPTQRKRKTANGDMLAYFRDNPQKLKEYEERQAKKRAALEKVAAELYDDFEYMTEAEKNAVLGQLARVGGRALAGAGKAVSTFGRKAQAAGRLRQIKAKNLMPGMGTVDADIARGARNVVTAPTKATRAATRGKTVAAAPAASGGLLSGKNLAKAGLVGAGGLGLYAGKKGIDTASALATPDHGEWNVPGVRGRGRVF